MDINIILKAEQYRNPKLCHAEVGADMAYRFIDF